MKTQNKWSLIFAVWMIIYMLPLHTASLPNDPVTAETAVLMDADTGQILYDKQMDTLRHPASITKVMTALLTVENSNLQDQVTVSDTAVQIAYNSSHIALTPGEEISVQDLLYALMLPSANDAANALAEHVGYSQQAFAEMMTARAWEVGAKNTHFENAHGLPEDTHLTTAYDMAMITRAAIQNQQFLQFFGATRYTILPTNMQPNERPLTNQQYMLLEDQDWCYNPDVIGGKVGYTDQARHTMTTVAQKDGRTLIAVVMGCNADQKFDDTQWLFDYGFDQFTPVAIEIPTQTSAYMENGEEIGQANFSPENPVSMLLPSNVSADQVSVAFEGIPDAVFSGDIPFAKVRLTTDQMPDLLLEIPLRMQLEPVVEALVIPQKPIPRAADNAPQIHPSAWMLILLLPLMCMITWIVFRRSQICKRASLRRRHRLRVLQQRQLDYRKSS